VTLIVGSAHWLGCIWWVLAHTRNFDSSTWVYRYCDFFLSPSSHVPISLPGAALPSQADIDVYAEEHGILHAYDMHETAQEYYLCLYWGFQSLTNLGYSDIMPDNGPELVLAWLLCVFQVSFYSYILGTLFSYVVTNDDASEAYRKSMDALQSYCLNRDLPPPLVARLKAYLHFQLKQSTDNASAEAVVEILPKSLLSKVRRGGARGIYILFIFS